MARFVQSHGLCGPSCSSAVGLYGSSCSSAFDFSQAHGACDRATRQLLVYKTLAVRQLSALFNPLALLDLATHQAFGLNGFSCSGCLGFSQPHAPCGLRCLSAFGQYAPSYTTAFGFGLSYGPRGPVARKPSDSSESMALRLPLLVGLRPIRLQVLGSLRLMSNPRPLWPTLFSSIQPIRPQLPRSS